MRKCYSNWENDVKMTTQCDYELKGKFRINRLQEIRAFELKNEGKKNLKESLARIWFIIG